MIQFWSNQLIRSFSPFCSLYFLFSHFFMLSTLLFVPFFHPFYFCHVISISFLYWLDIYFFHSSFQYSLLIVSLFNAYLKKAKHYARLERILHNISPFSWFHFHNSLFFIWFFFPYDSSSTLNVSFFFFIGWQYYLISSPNFLPFNLSFFTLTYIVAN